MTVTCSPLIDSLRVFVDKSDFYVIMWNTVHVHVHVYTNVHVVLHVFTDRGLQTFYTNGTNLFSRKFKTHEYFYCKNCKTYQFDEASCEADSLESECQLPCISYTDPSKGSDEEQGGTCPSDKNKTVCSCAHMEKSVIYIDGDPDKADS